MVRFVNAKINIGLNVTGKRSDGYHNIETVFFPVGLESGQPWQPEVFDDILEIVADPKGESSCRFEFFGRKIDCPPGKNLVIKAAMEFFKNYNEYTGKEPAFGKITIVLDKHLPSGAGLGGGSADAAFVISTLNEITGKVFNEEQLQEIASALGADCAFFIINKPCFGEGKGEILTPIDLSLKGYQLLLVKPEINVSTAEAFSNIEPKIPKFDLRYLSDLPVDKWKGRIVNDFEETIFPLHPELKEIKEKIYGYGAEYASMSGSGSCIYGIFSDKEKAEEARNEMKSTYSDVWLFGL